MLKIVTAPNSVLSAVAKPVNKVTPAISKIITEMKETLNKTVDPIGVGLAAPQIGKSLKIFVAKPTEKSKIMTFINPEILDKSIEDGDISAPKSDSKKLEGCLSLPNIWGPVNRPKWVVVSFLDEQGIKHKQKFTDFLATIIQHETDHLNGVLFPKHVLEQNGILYKSHKNKKGQDEFEEIEI